MVVYDQGLFFFEINISGEDFVRREEEFCRLKQAVHFQLFISGSYDEYDGI